MIVVVGTISEGVNGCDLAVRRIKLDFRYTPSIVRVSCDGLSILVNNSDYVALQILTEEKGKGGQRMFTFIWTFCVFLV